ncbi:hypothetical protein HaLaN_09851 [Haematococcus lacustris]|uniref:Uncharacterized protein n=1 Tax=Haematococcus lacustris TaxID=44745 RepID=A0A699Z3D0_HAELA|nr:hypothetical protein HaLaN_09851 [Haematococcus lacustris]
MVGAAVLAGPCWTAECPALGFKKRRDRAPKAQDDDVGARPMEIADPSPTVTIAGIQPQPYELMQPTDAAAVPRFRLYSDQRLTGDVEGQVLAVDNSLGSGGQHSTLKHMHGAKTMYRYECGRRARAWASDWPYLTAVQHPLRALVLVAHTGSAAHLDEGQPLRDEFLAVVHDEHTANVQLDVVPLLVLVEKVEGGALGDEQDAPAATPPHHTAT